MQVIDIKKITFFLCLLFLAAGQSAADVVIDVQAKGMTTRLMMNERFARMDNAADGSYLLLDRKNRNSWLVLPKTRQLMPIADQPGQFAQQLKVVLQPQPGERELMGYRTQHYRMLVNNRYCGDVMASTEAMHKLGLQPMLQALATLADQQLAAMGPYVVVIDSCTQASMSILSHSDRIGLPLRIYDNKGGLLSDIVNIDTQAKISNAALSLPGDYKQVASAKQLSPTQNLLDNARRYVPAIDEAYQRYFVRWQAA